MTANFVDMSTIGQINLKFKNGDSMPQFTTMYLKELSTFEDKKAFLELIAPYTNSSIRSVSTTIIKNTEPIPDAKVGNHRPRIFRMHIVGASAGQERYLNIGIPEFTGDPDTFKGILEANIRIWGNTDVARVIGG